MWTALQRPVGDIDRAHPHIHSYPQLRVLKMARQIQFIGAFVTLLCVGFVFCDGQADFVEEPQKRGGARPFYGFGGSGAKRISDMQPYYLYEKRGGGRAFFGSWNDYPRAGPRLERRGGGRAFSGGWSPDYTRFYDSPYFHKRSSNLWEFLQGGSDFYRK